MKNLYEAPAMELVEFESEEVITLSAVDSNPENAFGDNDLGDSWNA